jgi:hypothetical protein
MINIENIVSQVLTKPIKELLNEVNPVKNLKDLIINNSYNFFLLLFSSLSVSLLFVSGVVLTLVQLSYQYDQGYRFFVNGGIMTGLTLVGISILSLLIIKLITSNKKVKVEQPHIEMQVDIHPLELALANLINDFISEQNSKRSSKMEQNIQKFEQDAPTNKQLH